MDCIGIQESAATVHSGGGSSIPLSLPGSSRAERKLEEIPRLPLSPDENEGWRCNRRRGQRRQCCGERDVSPYDGQMSDNHLALLSPRLGDGVVSSKKNNKFFVAFRITSKNVRFQSLIIKSSDCL